MQLSQWTKCQDLFEQSVLLDFPQRDTLLQRECIQDTELFEHLMHLLDAHDNSAKILQSVRCQQLTLTPRNLSQQLIGPYQIVRKLGSGSMGVVYKAFDIRLERYLALKFLPHNLTTDERAKKRLLREAKAASALSHQHLCTVYDIEETRDGQIYIAMAYYEGKNFDALISAGTLTLKQAVTVACQMANGLMAAHAKSIIHRDIKPANVILNGDRGIKILDFGIAKFANMHNTDTAIQGGTVAYMSPEHILGEKLDQRTDIWSTAIILYEMISGKLPFAGKTLPETMHSVVQDPSPILSKITGGIPKSIDNLIDKALSKNINDRYQTMAEFLTDLEYIANELDPNYSSSSIRSITDKDNNKSYNMSDDSSHNNLHHSTMMPAEAPIEIVCTAVSLANYDLLNESLDPVVFQQLVGVYLKGIKQRISSHSGSIKTLVGNTIVCEFSYDPDLQPSSQRAMMATYNIHNHVQDIAKANDIALDCFITMTEVACSEFDILDGVRHLSSIANAMDTFASDAVYQSVRSDYQGVPIDSAQSKAFALQKSMWLIRDDILDSDANSAIPNHPNNQNNLATAGETTRDRLKRIDGDMTFVADHILEQKSLLDDGINSDPDKVIAKETPAAPAYQCHYVASNNFIGRNNQLSAIEILLADCISNRAAHIIHLTGVDGVGKSCLAAELLSMAQQLGFSHHQQISVEFGAAEELHLHSKICKSILSKSCGRETHAELSLLDYAIENETVDTSLLVYLYDLLGLTPNKNLDAEPMTNDQAIWLKKRNQVLIDIISFTADTKPLLILLDDIQWAGRYNVESFLDILSHCRTQPIIIICISDRNSLDIPSLLQKQFEQEEFSVFELAILDQSQSAKLATQIFDMTPDVVDTLLLASNSVPLKIAIMAQYVEATGKTDFPESIAELIMGFLSTLADDDIQALWAASIIGGIFSQSCIRYLIGKQEYECQKLVDIGLISTYGQLYIFSHPLLYRAVYDTIEDQTKLELHKQAAEWYAYVDDTIRAEHLDRAEEDEAISAYLQASTHLADIMHLEEAKKSLDRGLELAMLAESEEHIEQLKTLQANVAKKLGH